MNEKRVSEDAATERLSGMRPADQPGDELLKIATAQAVIFTIKAGGFKFNCPHCGNDCAVSAANQQQQIIVQHLAEKKELAFLGCPKCGRDFRVQAGMILAAGAASPGAVQRAVATLAEMNPHAAGGNRNLRRAAAASLKLLHGPKNGRAP